MNDSKFRKVFVFAAMFVVIVSIACGGASDSGTKVGELPSPEELASITSGVIEGALLDPMQATEAPASAPRDRFGVGDVVEIGDTTIAVDNMTLTPQKELIITFTIENHGDDRIVISSFWDFEARSGDGTELESHLCDDHQLNNDIFPGDKLRGNMCWENASLPVRVYYKPEIFGGDAVIWEIGQ